MKPMVSVMQKRQQGSTDVNGNGAVASHRWAAQNLIRLGELKSEDLTMDLWDGENPPDCFNDEQLSKINTLCHQHWDETHKQWQVGATKNGKMIECRFPRSNHGKLELGGNGIVRDPGFEHHMKCEKEAQFSTGCCLSLNDNGSLKVDSEGRAVGVVPPIWECTERKLVSNSECEKVFKSVIELVKTTPKKAPWAVSQWIEGAIVHQGENWRTLKGIGETSEKALEDMMKKNLTVTVNQFKGPCSF